MINDINLKIEIRNNLIGEMILHDRALKATKWYQFRKVNRLCAEITHLKYSLKETDQEIIRWICYYSANFFFENQTYNKLHELVKSKFHIFVKAGMENLKMEAKPLYLMYEVYTNFFLYYNFKYELTIDQLFAFVNDMDVKTLGIATEQQVKEYFGIE